MERKRDGLVPIGEALADLPGPVQALIPKRSANPRPRRGRGFTLADQVNQLVGASEADPDLGFMARTMALCSLPRSNPRDRLRYVRRNGPYTLVMNAGGLYRLPFGHLPRLLDGVDFDGGRAHSKPRVGVGRLGARPSISNRYLP